jgi:hypothetical protein
MRDRLRSADPLIGLVGLVSLVVYVLHGFDRGLSRDLGVYMYGGQRFLAGDPPYVAIVNRAGPLAHMLPGLGIWLGRLVGVSDIRAARVFFMLMAVVCVCLVHVLTRDLTGSRAAGLVAAAAFLGFQEFLELATNGPREKTAMVMFLLAAMLALLHRRWATCGVFIALGTLSWQPVFFAAIVATGVGLLLAPDRRVRAVVRFLIGGAATTAILLVYFALNSALHTFFEGFVLINAQYTHQPNPFSDRTGIWNSLKAGYGGSLWVIGVGMVLLAVTAVASARRAWQTRDAPPVTWVALGAGWLAGTLWSLRAFNAAPDLLVLLPFAACGIGGGLMLLLSRVDVRARLAVCTVLALVGTTYATQYSVTTQGHGLKTQIDAVNMTLRLGPHPATMISFQAPEALVIAHRTNPSPYQMFSHDLQRYMDDTYKPGGFQGYLDWVQRYSPTYIVVQTAFRPPWLSRLLHPGYQNVGGQHQFNIWVNKSVSRDVRDKMHQAIEARIRR